MMALFDVLEPVGFHFSRPNHDSDSTYFRVWMNMVNGGSYVPVLGIGADVYRIGKSLEVLAKPVTKSSQTKRILCAHVIRGIVGICLNVTGLWFVMVIPDLAMTALRFAIRAKTNGVNLEMLPIVHYLSKGL